MRFSNDLVREVLARHLERDVRDIHLSTRLDELDVTPLELVLTALEMEEMARTSLPVEELAVVETVADFCAFVARAWPIEEAVQGAPRTDVDAGRIRTAR